MNSNAKTVDDHMGELPENRVEAVATIRDLIGRTFPDEESP